MKFDLSYQEPNLHHIQWDELVVGYERSWDVPVTFAEVGWYADLAEDDNRWYTAHGSPWGPPVAPPLLLSRWGYRIVDPIGRIIGYVNTANRTRILAPALVGTVARYHGCIAEKFERNGRRFVRYHIEAADAETGQPLLVEDKEYSPPLSEAERAAAQARDAAKSKPERAPARPALAATLKLEPGAAIPGFERTITRMVMRSRQWHGTNVVHSDPAAAARIGMKAPVATGHIYAAYIQEMCVGAFGQAMFNGALIDMRFRRPVFENDKLAIGGEITEARREKNGLRLCVSAWADKATSGEEVARARIEVTIMGA